MPFYKDLFTPNKAYSKVAHFFKRYMARYILIFGQRKTMTYLCGQENTPIAVIAITARQVNVWLYTIILTHGRLLYKRYAYVKQERSTHRLLTHIHITHIYFLWKTKK